MILCYKRYIMLDDKKLPKTVVCFRFQHFGNLFVVVDFCTFEVVTDVTGITVCVVLFVKSLLFIGCDRP